MSNVVDFPSTEGPNGDAIKAYIEERIDFEISSEVYAKIDHAVGQFWTALPLFANFHTEDVKAIIRDLRSDGILFSEEQIHILATLFLEALESTGMAEED